MSTLQVEPDVRVVEDDGLDWGANDNRARTPNAELSEAMEDVRLWRNIHGPYATGAEAVRAMLED